MLTRTSAQMQMTRTITANVIFCTAVVLLEQALAAQVDTLPPRLTMSNDRVASHPRPLACERCTYISCSKLISGSHTDINELTCIGCQCRAQVTSLLALSICTSDRLRPRFTGHTAQRTSTPQDSGLWHQSGYGHPDASTSCQQ